MSRELTDAAFEAEVLKSSQPVLIDLWAPWCGPCRMLSPIIEKLGEEYKDKVKVFKLNTDDNPNTAVRYRVQAIPTLLFFKGGSMVEHMVGVQPEKEIRQRIENLLK
jgi:thioredoxin 1